MTQLAFNLAIKKWKTTQATTQLTHKNKQKHKTSSGWWFFATPLKNMSSSMGRIIPCMKWKIKLKFKTTNQ
jgi:hypothetical protein